MILKQTNHPHPAVAKARHLVSKYTRKKWRLRLAGIVPGLALFVGINLYCLYYGMFLYKTGEAATLRDAVDDILSAPLDAVLHFVPNAVSGVFAAPEHISIDIKHKDFQKLAYLREIRFGRIDGNSPGAQDIEYVPAKIRYGDRTLRAKIRLKGDRLIHLRGDQWSFRIELKDDQTLFGMRKFSIHHPRTRNYIYEWIFHQALRREGFIALRYDFVDVTLNGKHLGIYALEEHFEKRAVEHNRYREGPIVRFVEFRPHVDGFETKRWTQPDRMPLYTKAIHLLEAFEAGKLKTGDVFEVQELARFFALADLLGMQHATLKRSMRFYYNPVTAKLQPIGFDGHSRGPIPMLTCEIPVRAAGVYWMGYDAAWYKKLFADPRFFEAYLQQLEQIGTAEFLDSLFVDIEEALDDKLCILYRENPFFYFNKKQYAQNLSYIQKRLHPPEDALYAHLYRKEPAGLELQLGSRYSLPLEVTGISFNDSLLLPPGSRTILKQQSGARPIEYVQAHFDLPAGRAWADTMLARCSVLFRLLGSAFIQKAPLFSWPYLEETELEQDFTRRAPNVHAFAFVQVDSNTRTIRLQQGKWQVAQSLIIPAGYRVVAEAGTALDLVGGASILSRSPLEFYGTAEAPIRIFSSDSTGQGLAVLQAPEVSILRHVIFTNLAAPAQNGWELTGAVTFYESDATIEACQFLQARAEDGLNIIRSSFKISSSLFAATVSDAFDADFTRGEIRATSFVACGNDAVDVSGSTVRLDSLEMVQVGDKGVSAGERSRITAASLDIRQATIALASKDDSELQADEVSIEIAEVGLAVYQKKSEFGPANMAVKNLSMQRAKLPYLIEKGSRLIVQGEAKKATHDHAGAFVLSLTNGKAGHATSR